jgi:hypothetical protein
MGWADWASLLNNQLSPNILLGAHSNYWLKKWTRTESNKFVLKCHIATSLRIAGKFQNAP